MEVGIVGAGYVGLTTAACLAELGHCVSCYDVDAGRVAGLERGVMPIRELGLESLTRRHMMRGTLRFTSDLVGAFKDARLVFIAVGTPAQEDGQIDLSFVQGAARAIAAHLRGDAILVVKSTVSMGTCSHLQQLIAKERGDEAIRVASNPEFLREGSAVADFMKPDRIVIGADDDEAARLLEHLYRPLTSAGVPLVSTSTRNAELIKHAANAILALRLGFINDVAEVCERAGGDIAHVVEGLGLDRRIGRSFLEPGPGFGGSCFPKDTRAFAACCRQHGAPQRIIETLIEANDRRKATLARRILEAPGIPPKSRIAVLGVSFKANTDDIRESPALTVIPLLLEAGHKVSAHDPGAMDKGRAALADVHWASSAIEACDGAQAAVVLTEWDEYRTLDLKRVAKAMNGTALFDYRNLYDPRAVGECKLRHFSLGRPDRLAVLSREEARHRVGEEELSDLLAR